MFVSHHATVLLQKAAGLESVEMLVRIYTCPLFSLVQICQTIKVFFIRIDVCFFFALRQSWLSLICPEWLWKRAANRLNTALRQQALVRLQQRRSVSASSSSQSLSPDASPEWGMSV